MPLPLHNLSLGMIQNCHYLKPFKSDNKYLMVVKQLNKNSGDEVLQ